MEVVVPTANDFHFDSTASSPYVSAPSSPKRFGDPFGYYYQYTSAPTSPSRVAAIFSSSAGWEEEEEEMPRSTESYAAADLDDFAFDFSGQLEKGVPPPDLTTADELFEKGKIRPLNLSLDVAKAAGVASTTPRPPRRGEGTAAMWEATRERGRERGPSPSQVSSSSSRSRKGSRSLSPMRSGGAGGLFTPKEEEEANIATADCLKTTSSSSSRKWRLRDLLLFRSASEGRVTGNKSKDPLRKYTIMSSPPSPKTKRKGGEDSRTSSFRSTDSGGGGGSMRRGSGQPVSAHEMHYMSNRAASEEMKKKTALPFNHRHGLFSCLRLNPAMDAIAKGFHNTHYSFGRRQS